MQEQQVMVDGVARALPRPFTESIIPPVPPGESNSMSESANRSGVDKSVTSKTEIVIMDIIAITDRFVEARYCSHVISPNLAGKVKHHWERIKRVLRKI
jgi:hypothetical protein